MEDNLISIVVPIYNVEKYLEKCIDSIINQSYKNIEVILVDDGSPDNCPKICDEYKNKDSRIKVIHKKNGGLSDARNAGIEIASGKYITFVDSDDYIDEDFVKELLKSILENKAQIAICSVQKFNEKTNFSEILPISNVKVLNGKEVILDLKKFSTTNVVAWNKLYERRLFEDIRYPIGKINEDEFTTYKLLYKCNKVAINQKALYYYRYNENSIMNRKFNNNRLHVLEALEERMNFFKDRKEDSLYIDTINIYLNVIIYLYDIGKEHMDCDTKKYVLKKYREMYKFAKKNNYIQNNKKILRIMFYIMPNLYVKMKKLK